MKSYLLYPNKDYIKGEIKETFKDLWFDTIVNHLCVYDKYIKDIDCFGISDTNSGYAALLSKDKRIINIKDSIANEYGEESLNNIIDSCENIYVVATDVTVDRAEGKANEAGFVRKEKTITFKTNFINFNDKVVLFEVEKKK